VFVLLVVCTYKLKAGYYGYRHFLFYASSDAISAGNDMRFLPEQPEQPEKIGVIRQKTAESSGQLSEISDFKNGDFGFFLVQANATKK